MKLEPGTRVAGPVVTGLAPTGFRIDRGEPVPAVLLAPEWWRPWDGVLSAAALKPLAALAPEFILLGTGGCLVRPPRDLVAALEAQGVGIESMDSRAAARAWGVLRGEGRWIAAALMALT